MTRALRWLFWAWLIAALLAAVALGAAIVWGLPELLPPGTVVIVEGERHEVGDLRAMMAAAHPGHWLIGALAVFAAAAVIVLVLPLAIVFALLVPLAAGALGLALGLGAVALVISPLLLLGWLLWRWLRPARTERGAPTIGA